MFPSTEVPKRLEKCAAYKGYYQLLALPENAPSFELDDDGYPIVHLGEVFCRMPGKKRGLCGQKYVRRQRLLEHLERDHGADKAERPRLSADRGEAATAIEHYVSLMIDEDYEGKGSDGVSSNRLRSSNRPRMSNRSRMSKAKATNSFVSVKDLEGSAEPRQESTIETDQGHRTVSPPSDEPLRNEPSSQRDDDYDTTHIKVEVPTPITIDSDDEDTHQIKSEAVQDVIGISDQTRDAYESDDKALELAIEEDEVRLRAEEIRLRLLENKRKLAARKKQRRERQ